MKFLLLFAFIAIPTNCIGPYNSEVPEWDERKGLASPIVVFFGIGDQWKGKENDYAYYIINKISRDDESFGPDVRQTLKTWLSYCLDDGISAINLDNVLNKITLPSHLLNISSADQFIDEFLALASKEIKGGGFDPFEASSGLRRSRNQGETLSIRLNNIIVEGLSTLKREGHVETKLEKDGSIHLTAKLIFKLIKINSDIHVKLLPNEVELWENVDGKLELVIDEIAVWLELAVRKSKDKKQFIEIPDIAVNHIGDAVSVKVKGLECEASRSLSSFIQWGFNYYNGGIEYDMTETLKGLSHLFQKPREGPDGVKYNDLMMEKVSRDVVNFILGPDGPVRYPRQNKHVIKDLDWTLGFWFSIKETVQDWVASSFSQVLSKIDLDDATKMFIKSCDQLGSSCTNYQLMDTILSLASAGVKKAGLDPFRAPTAGLNWFQGCAVHMSNVQVEGLSKLEKAEPNEARKDKDGSILVNVNFKFPSIVINSDFTLRVYDNKKPLNNISVSINGISIKLTIKIKKEKAENSVELTAFQISKLGYADINVKGLTDAANGALSKFLGWSFNNFNSNIINTIQTPISEELKGLLKNRN